jgi:hypothetical protein
MRVGGGLGPGLFAAVVMAGAPASVQQDAALALLAAAAHRVTKPLRQGTFGGSSWTRYWGFTSASGTTLLFW